MFNLNLNKQHIVNIEKSNLQNIDPTSNILKVLKLWSKFELFPYNEWLETSLIDSLKYIVYITLIAIYVLWMVNVHGYSGGIKIRDNRSRSFDTVWVRAHFCVCQACALCLGVANVINLNKLYDFIKTVKKINSYDLNYESTKKLRTLSNSIKVFILFIVLATSMLADEMEMRAVGFSITNFLSAYSVARVYIFYYFTVAISQLLWIHIESIYSVTQELIGHQLSGHFSKVDSIRRILHLTDLITVISSRASDAIALQVLFLFAGALVLIFFQVYHCHVECTENDHYKACVIAICIFSFFCEIICSISYINSKVKSKVCLQTI